MIDLDFNDVVDQVRAIIGDPDGSLVTDNTINSALSVTGNDVEKASLKIAQALLKWFSTQADREREGQVEVYYTKLYERYKDTLEQVVADVVAKSAIGIPVIIGGVSVSERSKVFSNTDNFTVYDVAGWDDLLQQYGKKFKVDYI